jgi:hypothetical protein
MKRNKYIYEYNLPASPFKYHLSLLFKFNSLRITSFFFEFWNLYKILKHKLMQEAQIIPGNIGIYIFSKVIKLTYNSISIRLF